MQSTNSESWLSTPAWRSFSAFLFWISAAGFLLGARYCPAAEDYEELLRSELPGEVTAVEQQVIYDAHGPDQPTQAREGQKLGYGDSLGTLALSRASVELQGRSPVRMWQWTKLVIETNSPLPRPELSIPSVESGTRRRRVPAVRAKEGRLHFISRSQPQVIEIRTEFGTGTPQGTEFSVAVDPLAKRVEFQMIDGSVELANESGSIRAEKGFLAVAEPGRRPWKARLSATNLVQWWLYYPAVLDPHEMGLELRHSALSRSFARYQLGDLPGALRQIPEDSSPTVLPGAIEKAYVAMLLLSAGGVDEAEDWLDGGGNAHSLGRALRMLMTAVNYPANTQPAPSATTPPPRNLMPASSSECLALSYLDQARHDLPAALEAAREAVRRSPRFGFGWARVAELEFSHGRSQAAERAVAKALRLTPSNAQAHALSGFLLAGQNRMEAALRAFETAIHLDPALANGWLGRGLCRIRRGQLASGRRDLRTAANLESDRSLVRSYLGKAFADSGLAELAAQEFARAKELDPRDPTPWLYSALLKEQQSRPNEAIADLNRSLYLQGNRRVYRSPLLLDQDRAVGSANLALVYADVGMAETGFREAARAVNADYSNATAHRFLADSYHALRDPRQVNIRYETPWLSEFLLANLLSPVGGGSLSQTVSQNEYSKLFQRDHLGVANETLWTSNGDWVESAAQYGQSGNLEYALDALYRSESGQRRNSDLEQWTLAARVKYQLTSADSIYLQSIGYDASSGDLAQFYRPEEAHPGFRLQEEHDPIPLAGWHHAWQPGVDTLILFSPWRARAMISDSAFQVPYGSLQTNGLIDPLIPADPPAAMRYETEYSGWSAETQQLWRSERHTLLAGSRFQQGTFDTRAWLDVSALDSADLGQAGIWQERSQTELERITAYAYYTWQPQPWVLTHLGLSYDRLTLPLNFTEVPLTTQGRARDLVSPKLGLTLTPWAGGVVRGAYTRSLSGASFDQSYRLEPVQVAGFTQVYRGLMPESLAGLVAGQEMETAGLAFDQQLGNRTYVHLTAQQLDSQAHRGVGAFLFDYTTDQTGPSTLAQSLTFQERTAEASVHQVAGDRLVFGARYRWSEADLTTDQDKVVGHRFHERSVLQQAGFSARLNDRSGLFASWESVWTAQSNQGDATSRPGAAFWQHHLWVGHRFWRRHAELALGVLNLTDQDYRLYPLNFYQETYRDRTLALSGRFSF